MKRAILVMIAIAAALLFTASPSHAHKRIHVARMKIVFFKKAGHQQREYFVARYQPQRMRTRVRVVIFAPNIPSSDYYHHHCQYGYGASYGYNHYERRQYQYRYGAYDYNHYEYHPYRYDTRGHNHYGHNNHGRDRF